MRRLAAAVVVLAVVVLTAGRAGAQDAGGPPPQVDATTSTTIPGTETFGGQYPPGAYTLLGKTDITKPDQTFYTTTARGFFDASDQINTLSMAATIWTWKYDLTQAFRPIVQTMADVTQQRVVGPFGLVHFALILLAVYVGGLLLRGRLVHGIGELAMAMLCMVIAGWVALNPVGFFVGSTALLREVSTAMATPDSGADGGAALTGNLQRGLIHDPWEWLSFGHIIDGTKCAPAVDEALAPKPDGGGGIVGAVKDAAGKAADIAAKGVVGPGADIVESAASTAANLQFKSGTDKAVSSKLDDLGCPVEKAAYENPSPTKIFGAFLLLLASVVVAILALVVDLAVIVAQFVFMLIAIMAPLAVVFAILPGRTRDLFWRFVAAGAKAFVAAVAGCYLLVVTLGFIGGILTVGGGDLIPMELRMLMIVAIPVVAFLFRKKILHGASHMSGAGVARAGSYAPSANANSLHMATAGSASAALGVMGADPNYSLRQQGRQAVGVGQRAIKSKPGQVAIAAATGGMGLAAATGVGLRDTAMRAATRVALSTMPRRRPDVDVPEPERLELTTIAGRDRSILALDPGPQGTFTMPNAPGDAAPRAGALPGPTIAGALNSGPPPIPPRPRRGRRNTDEWPTRGQPEATNRAGYTHEAGPAPTEVVYHPDPASARAGALRGSVRSDWDRQAEHRILRLHEQRSGPLTVDEIDPTLQPARRRRVAAMSNNLWHDQRVASTLSDLGVLRLTGSSPEERHWLKSADFTQAREMTKLRGYQADGRLRLRGEGLVPKDQPLHRHAARVYEGRPIVLPDD